MSRMDPVAYAYAAALHCPDCALARFGRCPDGLIACAEHGAADASGDPVAAVFPWDPMPCHSACDACGWELDGSECVPSRAGATVSECCPECDGACPDGDGGRCKVCPTGWRERASQLLWDRDGLPRVPHAYHGALWHALTGRTAPERGQTLAPWAVQS